MDVNITIVTVVCACCAPFFFLRSLSLPLSHFHVSFYVHFCDSRHLFLSILPYISRLSKMHLLFDISNLNLYFSFDCGKLHSIVHFCAGPRMFDAHPHRESTEMRFIGTFYFKQFFPIFVSPFIRLLVSNRNQCRKRYGAVVMILYS